MIRFDHTYYSLVPESVYQRIGRLSMAHYARHGIISVGAVSEKPIRGTDGLYYDHAIAVYGPNGLSPQDLTRLFPDVPGEWQHVDHSLKEEESTILQ